ncbi:MAG: SDR family oxidoreductase [Paludibacter sp.]
MEKVALITGSSRGIGKAIVDKFKANNYCVLTPSRNEMNLNANTSIEAYCKNIAVNIDVIINCAGINTIAKINDIEDSDIISMLQINLLAPLKVIQHLNDKMGTNNIGHIVNISSIWSFVSKEGRCGYSATKAAINGITRTLALELASKNILINSVAPGYVNTELTKQNNTLSEITEITSSIPLQRFAEPEEIANLVYFLSSDQNTYITGQTIIIDGGYVCR